MSWNSLATHFLYSSIQQALIFILVLCVLPCSSWADTSIYQYYLNNIGDQGSVELTIENTTTYQKSFTFGPTNGNQIQQSLKQFEQAHYIIQCHKRNDLQNHPRLTLTLDQER